MAFNGIKYIKNVTKSFGYAMVDVVGEMNPVIQSFSEANGDLGKELYNTVKDYKGTAKKIKKSVVESDVYEFAKNYKRNLFEDLKTGKFYNKERMDDIATKAGGWSDEQLSAEFADMFSDDDDEINFDDWDKDELRSDMFMAEHIDDVGEKISQSNAEVTIRSAEYMANVQKETTKALYAQNNRLFGQALQGMAAINANVGQLVGMPELMQVHTNNASTFFEKTSGQLDQITSLLDTLVKNTSPSTEEAQRREDENPDLQFRDIFTSKGMPNIKKYMQYAKNNLMNNTGELAMLGDLFGNGVSMLQTLAASPLESAMKAGIKQLIPTVVKKSMDQFNDTLQGFFGSAITKLNRSDSDSPILNFIQKIFGIQPDLKTDFDTSRYEKGKVNWDGVSRKALVEVIPGQLAKIASALTGEDPLIFNPDTGMMESVGWINDRANNRLQDAANSAGYKLRKQINDYLINGKHRFSSKDAQDKWEDDLDAFFMSIFQNGGLNASDLTINGLQNMLKNGSNSKLLKEVLDRISESGQGKSAMLDLNRRVLSGIDQYTAQMNDLEAKGSADSVLYNGMFESFLERYNSDEEKVNRTATGISKVKEGRERSSLFIQIDEYGHNIFYYLQGIFQRQDAIYENSSFMVENWGSGRGKGKGKYKAAAKGTRAAIRDIKYNSDITSLEKEVQDQLEREDKWYRDDLERAQKEDPSVVVGETKDDLYRMSYNNDVAEYEAKMRDQDNDSNKTLVDKLLAEKTLDGKFGVLVNGTKSFIRSPLEGIAKMFDSASDSMYNLIYGEHPSDELKDMGFIGVVKQNIQGTFDKMNTWIDEHVLNPLKDKFGIENRDDFFRKLFGIFDKDYDEFKEKKKEGLFGKYDEETKRRSGGILGDYIQDVKDNAKGAFGWMKDGFKDVKDTVTGGSNGVGMFDAFTTGNKIDMGQYATGGTVQKTGIAAVSKGELIIPSEMNPFYHGVTNKAQQIRDENQAVRNFFGSYAKGGTVDDQNDIDYVIVDVSKEMRNNGIDENDLRKYLLQVPIDEKLHDHTDSNGKFINMLNERVRFLTGKARAFIKGKAKNIARQKLKGQQISIEDYDKDANVYMTNDGVLHKVKEGTHVGHDKDGNLQLYENAQSFLGETVLNLAQGAKTVYRSLTDGSSSEEQGTAFDSVIDDVTGNFKSYAGAMTVGGGIGAAVSALTGMVGGPLVGAAVGSAIGLTMKSDTVQKWLFGDIEDGERQGGVFSKETAKFIEEKVPSMAKFGMAGGAAGLLMGHPMLGTFIGSAVGFAQKSETFGNILFNGVDKDGNKHKGILDMTQDEFNKKVQKKLPRIGAGALAAMMAGPFGTVGNLIVGSAIGFASDTEGFKAAVFGSVGKDGERHGGIVGAFREEVIKPFGSFMKKQGSGIIDWLEEDIKKPLTDSIEPLAKQLGLFTKSLLHPIKWLSNLGTRTDSWLGRRLEGKLFRGVRSFASNVADAGIGLAKGTIGLPLQLIGAAGSRARLKQIARGNADYMTAQERLDYADEHNEIGGIGRDFSNAGESFVTGWNKLRTPGKRLSGIGNMISGVAKTATSFGNIGGHLIRGANRGIDQPLMGHFRQADEWMAGASVDEKKQMRTLLISASDAQKGKSERIKNLQRDLDANIRANTFNLLNPRDRDKFIVKVKKDGNSLDDLRDFLKSCKTRAGKKLTDAQVDEIMGTIEEGVTELRRLQALKDDKDLDREKEAALEKLRTVGDGKYKWMADALQGDFLHKGGADKLISMLNYDIDMDDKYNQENAEDDQAARDALERQEDHKEAMNLGKVIANLLAASVGMKQPYDEVKVFTKNDQVTNGSPEDVSTDGSTTSTKDSKNPADIAKNNLENADLDPLNLHEDTENPEQQDKVPAAAFGGFVKKAGKAVLSAGELVAEKGSGLLDKVKEFIGDGEESEGEQQQESSNVSPNFKGNSAVASAAPALGAAAVPSGDGSVHVGDYKPGQIVWLGGDRRYKYDGESQELIPDNDAAKQYDANKKKAASAAGKPLSDFTKPDNAEAKAVSDDTKTLESLFGSMGLGDGLGKMLGAFKNLSWIPNIAGSLAIVSFLNGNLDGIISDAIQGIATKLGWSDETKSNLTLSGKDGEEGYGERANKRIWRNSLSLANVKGGSKLLGLVSDGLAKGGDKLLGKERLRGKVAGAASKAAGGGFGLLGRGVGALEDVFEYGVNKANRSIIKTAKAGKLGKGAQKFFENFSTVNFMNTADKVNILEAMNPEKTKSVLGKGEGFVGQLIDRKSGRAVVDASGKLKIPTLKQGKGGFKSILSSIKDSKQTNKLVKGIQEAADSGSKEAKDEAISKFKEWLVDLADKGKIDKKFVEHGDELANGILDLGEKAGKNAAKKGAKKSFIGNLKSMGPIGWATTLVMAVTDFTSGYQNANTILGISDATTSEKIIAGLLKSIKGVIEGIIACVPAIGTVLSIGLSIIPEKDIVTLFVNVFKNVLSPVKKLSEKRKAMTDKVNAYNEKTGKNYDTEQYLKTVNNDRTSFEKMGKSLKTGLHNLGVSITGKGNKIDNKQNQDSGYDEDGNFIEGYLNKSTKRWKDYYAKAINKGNISADYAEALYINECLADSELKLDDARRNEYQQRLSEFKSAHPDMPIPQITSDLHGLINKGQVYSSNGKGGYKRSHLFGNDKSVDYGNGKSSQDFVGKFATGGLIEKSGLAALSKGELRTTPAKFISGLLGGLNKTSDMKEYDDLTDMGSFISDIQKLDPSKTEWKDYWARIDSENSSKGLLGILKKTLYKVAATMFMPSFAMGKMLDKVNSSLGSSLGIDSSSGSSDNSSSTGDSDTTKKKGILSRAVGAALNLAKGIFGFGKGSGLYGGASNLDDGSFISQLASKDQYGDSSYAEEGCAPATAAMLINKVSGNNMTMEEAGKYALNHGYKVKGDGTKESFFKDIFSSKGIASESVGDSRAVLNNLKAGKPTIILGQDKDNKSKKYSPFGKNPHYVLATGVDKNGNIIVNDPEAKHGGKRYKPSILGKMKSAISTKTAGGRSGFGLGKLLGGGSFDDMHTGNNGINLITSCEGLSEKAYRLAGEKYYTIGYGHYGEDVKPNQTITKEGAKQLLAKDLISYENHVKKYVTTFTPNQNQFDALVSYCYNRGPGGLRELASHSTTPEDYSKNIVIYWGSATRYKKGLIARRKKEQELFNSTAENFVPSGDYSSSDSSSSSESTGDSGNILSGFDSIFKTAMSNLYGSDLLSSLTSAGLFSGFGDEESTNASGGEETSPSSSGSAPTVTTADGAVISSSTTLGQDVATDSANYVGNRYVWGGNDLNKGVDCSGFVQQLYKKHGYDIKARRSVDQFNDTTHGTTITGGTYKDLKPGDAMYFSSNGKPSGIHHTGIYVGNGHMIHAQGEKTGIVDTDLSKSSSYQKEYIGAKRFGSGSGLSEPNVSDILTNTFKSSSKKTAKSAPAVKPQFSSRASNVLSTLARGSNGSMSLDNLVESIEKIAKLLQSIADNTEPIAQICKLITGMNDDNKEAKKKQEDAEKSTRKSISVPSSSKGGFQSSNSSDILQILTAFSQV